MEKDMPKDQRLMVTHRLSLWSSRNRSFFEGGRITELAEHDGTFWRSVRTGKILFNIEDWRYE